MRAFMRHARDNHSEHHALQHRVTDISIPFLGSQTDDLTDEKKSAGKYGD